MRSFLRRVTALVLLALIGAAVGFPASAHEADTGFKSGDRMLFERACLSPGHWEEIAKAPTPADAQKAFDALVAIRQCGYIGGPYQLGTLAETVSDHHYLLPTGQTASIWRIRLRGLLRPYFILMLDEKHPSAKPEAAR